MRRFGLLAFLGWAFCACGSSVPDYPLIMDICDGGYCPPPGLTVSHAATSTGTASGSSSTGGVGGAGPTSDLSGTVHSIASPAFTDSGTSFSGAASIAIYPSKGNQINAGYGGSSGTTFDAQNLPAGKAWLFVEDQSMGASGVWSTVSSLTLPQIGTVALPVIDQALVTGIAATLPTVMAKGVSTTASHVVLLLTHAGAPYKGVQVTGGSGGALIAYTGAGTYSDSATTTGTAGVALLFDTSLSGLATITVTELTSMKSWPVEVLTGAGAITLASADLE
jgi:hypothetical protein